VVCSLTVGKEIYNVQGVGALTNKVHAFKARSWELLPIDAIDVFDSMGSNIRLDVRGISGIIRTLPVANDLLNLDFISDKVRSTQESLNEQRMNSCFVKQHETTLYCTGGTFTLTKAIIVDDAIKLFLRRIVKPIFMTTGRQFEHAVGLSTSTIVDMIPSNTTDVTTSVISDDFLCATTFKRIMLAPTRAVGTNSNYPTDYRFNTSIEQLSTTKDLILLIGVNLRVEMPLLAMRLRQNHTNKILANFGFETNDTTLDGFNLGNKFETIRNIFRGKHNFALYLTSATRPAIVIGSSFLQKVRTAAVAFLIAIKSSVYVGDLDWREINFLGLTASHVGSLDAGVYTLGARKSNVNVRHNLQARIFYALNNHDVMFDNTYYDTTVIHLCQNYHNYMNFDLVFPTLMAYEKKGIYVNISGLSQASNQAVIAVSAYRTADNGTLRF